LGFSTLDLDKFKESFISSFNFDACRTQALKGDAVGNGSRTFTWRLFLGVIPEDGDLSKWVQAIRKVRADYYKKSEDL
jgi:TBC1 domain family member 5